MAYKRILFLSPNLGRGGGGAERQIVTVACLLKETGCEVEFLCYAEGDFYAHILKEKQIPIFWYVLSNPLKRMLAIRQFVRRGHYNAVISFLETPNFLNNFAAIGGKRWKVITGERSAQERTFLSKKGKIFCWFQRFSDYIVCNSENAREMWMEYYPQYGDKLTTIYNSIILQPTTSSYVPKRDSKLHIVVAASYQYLKNAIGVVEALALLNEAERNRICVDWYGKREIALIGTKVYDECLAAIYKYGLQEVIMLHEDTKDIHNRMNEADVVALFSRYEGLPNAICEGMMLGKPIIMTRVSDYKILVDGTNGVLCEWDKPETIKEAFVKVMNLEQEELLQMGEYSRQKAEKLFRRETILQRWNCLIQN